MQISEYRSVEIADSRSFSENKSRQEREYGESPPKPGHYLKLLRANGREKIQSEDQWHLPPIILVLLSTEVSSLREEQNEYALDYRRTQCCPKCGPQDYSP